MLDPADRDALRAGGAVRRYAAGDVLCHQGDQLRHVIVLLEGRVRIETRGRTGQDVVLGSRGPGQAIGELAAVDGQPRSATVRAESPLRVLMVSADRFVVLCQRRPGLSWALLRMLVGRLRELSDQQAMSAGATVTERLAGKLLSLAEDQGAELVCSQQELANMVGGSRESVVRALRDMRDQGVLNTARRRITILQLDKLRHIAS